MKLRHASENETLHSFSCQCLALGERHPNCSVGSLIPSLSIQAHDQKPEAERALPQKRGQLDPGDEIAGKGRCKKVRETVDQERQTGDRVKYADDSRKKR